MDLTLLLAEPFDAILGVLLCLLVLGLAGLLAARHNGALREILCTLVILDLLAVILLFLGAALWSALHTHQLYHR